jgi:PadR family transcriptional regulator, regulatory protein PadR
MIETRLGDFEEVMMLMVGILPAGDAYSFRIVQEFKSQTGRTVSIGAAHATLDRLETKGFLRSEIKEGNSARGGRRKRVYAITALGKRVIKESMDFKVSLWKQYPAFSGKFDMGY